MNSGLLSSPLLDLLPDAVILVDAAGRVLRTNANADALLGHPEGGLAGQPPEAWLVGASRPDWVGPPLTARALTGSQVLRSADGGCVAVRMSAREARLEDGNEAIVLSLHRAPPAAPGEASGVGGESGSAIHGLLEALQRNEERLAYATTVSNVGLFEHFMQPVPPPPPWWSPSLRALLGYDADATPDFGWYQSRIHPEDAGALLDAIARSHDPSRDGRIVAEYRWHHPDKGIRWLLTRSATIFGEVDGQRVPVRGLGAIIDVTERRIIEDEARRRAEILEATPDYVAVADLDGRLIDLNVAARALLGLAPDAEINELQLRHLHDSATAERLCHEAMPAAKTHGHWSGETEYRRHDGEPVPVAQHILAHRDSAGELRYLSTIARDLTKEKRLEEQFRHAQKMEAVGRLAGGVAHDFNNLLSVILGYADLAVADLGERHPVSGLLDQIVRAAHRAESLTRQLLAFGRRQILKPRVIDINEALAEFLPMVSRLVDERIEVQVVPARRALNIKADPNQLQQVLLNLAVNARDAMPDGGVLTIEAFQSTLEDSDAARHLKLPAGTYSVIAVSDTGHGMNEHTRQRIFEPFFTTKGPQAGTGLGLATVIGIVQQSGGNVWVYSEPSRGTTFKLYFPCTTEAAEDGNSLPAPAAIAKLQTGVVLVAEDDEQVRSLMGDALLRAGFEVLSASCPAEAEVLAAAHEGKIDLLLTDVVMPQCSGAVLADRLRETRPELPVLFTSGYTENTIVHQGVLDEGVDFLPKPVTPARLLEAIGEVLQRRGR